MTKPSVGQSVLCVVGFLGLQALFNWMDSAATKDLFVAGVIIMATFAAWAAYRITKRR